VVCTPPGRDATVDPALLFAARSAGATEAYKVGGAQAIAAMAFGTATIRSVNKVFGPGNAYVVMAKRLLFGQVAVDLLPGPSEVLVLADDSANPAFSRRPACPGGARFGLGTGLGGDAFSATDRGGRARSRETVAAPGPAGIH
jgi:hypothetical protein